MLVGIGVLAAPVAALGMVGYTLATKQKKIKKAAAIGLAVKGICDVQSRRAIFQGRACIYQHDTCNTHPFKSSVIFQPSTPS
jgi:hypothetical protein